MRLTGLADWHMRAVRLHNLPSAASPSAASPSAASPSAASPSAASPSAASSLFKFFV